ncbi:MAG: formylmethanofuran--tetrahydromethanopterin N-formyltransferase [Desulfatiglans sp.]|jgi:formylmethanofuran--tetrahydromethanopterin N-formyltransferase|nr:formylmethanofuran--tetrahydromethanopterin N-formyltransferase [Desulfatiglans sp.]
MKINNVEIEDTFAEAFGMKAVGIIVTALNEKWAMTAAQTATGFATSIIGCGCEAGIDTLLSPEDTPDGRPGVRVLFFTMSTKDMEKQLMNRIGQCIMTSPTSACFNDLASDKRIKTGGILRFFGDGFQSSKLINGRRFWRVPVMDGEFLLEESYSLASAIGGGNFFILAKDLSSALTAAEASIEEMKKVPGVIMPFPGGIVRSGSKVGSRYKGQHVSVNTPYCPTIRSRVETCIPEGVNAVLEIVIDGLSEDSIKEATKRGILKACMPGVIKISAGNYGGKLGQYHFHLREILKTV